MAKSHSSASLIDALPLKAIDITLLPEQQQRRLYDAFHLELHYDLPQHALILRVTIDAETAHALLGTIDSETHPPVTAPVGDPVGHPSQPPASGWDALRALPGARHRTAPPRPAC